MAKKKGAALRAKKRAREALDELQERQAEEATTKDVTEATNDQLFVIDTSGDVVPHHERPQKQKRVEKVSEIDQKHIEKLKKSKSPKELAKLVEEGRKKIPKTTGLVVRTHGIHKKPSSNYDLWDQKETKIVTKEEIKPGIGSALAGTAPEPTTYKNKPPAKLTGPQVKVQVAHGGQSYHPDPQNYKKAIQKAVGLELRREEAQKYKDTPISNGLSEETKALLVGDSDSSDDEDEESLPDGPVGELPKRSNKLTRAERNKQKRLKAEKLAREKAKQEKKLRAELSQVGKYKKDLTKDDQERANKKKELEAGKEEERPLGKDVEDYLSSKDPIKAPSLPVALKTELKSSLRTVKPKGSLVADRISSLLDRSKMTPKPQLRKQGRKRLSVKGRGYKDGVGNDWIVMG